jgi:hypothetical protein
VFNGLRRPTVIVVGVFCAFSKTNSPDKYQEIKALIKTIYQRHKGRYGLDE